MAREINLVPDIKEDMIKALKLRNLIFFLAFVVAVASVSTIVITGSIAGGQQIAINNRDDMIVSLSNKLSSYEDLNDFLTIKDQLGGVATLTSNKRVFPRTFNILSAMIPQGEGADTISISTLNVDLSKEDPLISMEANANAENPPYIDYNVLDAFKKSMEYLRYDYGRYVDENGNEIPAYCMIETDKDGSYFKENQSRYAYWTINAEGCNPNTYSSSNDLEPNDDSGDNSNSSSSHSSSTVASLNKDYTEGRSDVEDYDGKKVVRIWRTPQVSWYKANHNDKEPYMESDGTIYNVPHFNSACTTYTVDTNNDKSTPRLEESNEGCRLVPQGESGITISEHSNGRGDDGNLVLRFNATIALAPEAYQFEKYHMIALPPSGRRNVTDSYVQLQTIFGERANDCAQDDESCKDTKNSGDNLTDNADNKKNNKDNGDE